MPGNDLPSAKEPEGQETPKETAGRTNPKKRRRRKHRTRGEKRQRHVRSFPAATFEETLVLPQAIQQYAGQRVRRLTLFDHLGKAPDSGPSRQLITNSSKYGLTVGGYQAEHLELTPDGNLATTPDASPVDQLKARFRLAIANIDPFNELYEHFKGNRLPANQVMRDYLRHACRLPTVQLIRGCDRIRFDLDQFRTINIDTASIYTLVPQLETYRSQIANHVCRALENPDVDNPLTVYYPDLKVIFPAQMQQQAKAASA